ncbi:MAG: hypothetical protein JWR19_2569 [Pedosphaera sp.]|nr:hypothetical protein [Pedosphaera sp.]
MNLLELQRKLIAVARANPPADTVPYAFEKRILARLTGRPTLDLRGFWERGLARAAMFSVAAMLLMSAWSVFVPANNSETLSQDVEKTLFAAVDNAGADFAGDSR